MKILTGKFLCLVLLLSLFSEVSAQSLVEDANLSVATADGSAPFTETIKIISASKKIFILTNNNQQLTPGDFISLALGNDLAARALVAKMHQGQVGIKILKIYSLNQWSKLRRGSDVQIIKGDDSAFGKNVTEAPAEGLAKIKSEDDLYTGDVVVENDLEVIDDNKNRHIKPDNVVALSGSSFAVDEIADKGGRTSSIEYGISWAYQFADNYFIEGLYGRAQFNNFPGDGANTLVNRIGGRIKYNIKGPLYTFFMPYLGFQSFTVSSPQAGKGSDPNQNQQEIDVIDDLKTRSGPTAGVTVLRRLVPGWFLKGNLGTDLIDIGFAVEF